MAEYTLTAQTPLEGYQKTFANSVVSEATNLSIISLAVPQGGDSAFKEKIRSACGCELPLPGRYSVSLSGGEKLLWMQQDQYFFMLENTNERLVEEVSEKLVDSAYQGDQSDSWVILRITGPESLAALERLCPIDLHPEAFPDNAVSRTVMEHMSAIIIKESSDRFLLMGIRSSATSFLHAIELSFNNIIE